MPFRAPALRFPLLDVENLHRALQVLCAHDRFLASGSQPRLLKCERPDLTVRPLGSGAPTGRDTPALPERKSLLTYEELGVDEGGSACEGV